AASSLYVTGDFSLTGVLAIDVDFINAKTDWISVGAIFTVGNSTLAINRIGASSTTVGLEIITAGQILDSVSNLVLPLHHRLTLLANAEDGVISAMLSENGAWNIFVTSFNTLAQNTLVLREDIKASREYLPAVLALGSAPFNTTAGIKVNGNNKIVDADKISDLGFALTNSSITFSTITFKNFTISADSAKNASVINAYESTVTFIGAVYFTSNNAGAAGNGGAISAYASQITFQNTQVDFSSNYINAISNDIYLADEKSIIKLVENNTFVRGLRISGLGAILKMDNGTINFNGGISALQAGLNISGGAINFNEEVFIDSGVYVNNAVINFSSASITQNLTLNKGTINFSSESFLNDVSVNNGIINFSTSVMNVLNVLAATVNFRSNISTASSVILGENAKLSLQNDIAQSSFYVAGDLSLTGVLAIDVDFENAQTDWISVGASFINAGVSTLTINKIGLTSATTGLEIISAANSMDLSNLNFSANYRVTLLNEGRSAMLSENGAWNVFITSFNTIKQNVLVLGGDINAAGEYAPAVLAFGSAPFNVGGLSVEASGNIKNIDADEFIDLGFVLTDSSITFLGLTFKNFKTSQEKSGAVINAQNSSITFTGAITFTSNNAGQPGGAVFVRASQIVFQNAQVNFSTNYAADISNDIHLADSKSIIKLIGNNTFTNGVKISGLGSIEKADAATTNFNGVQSLLQAGLIVGGGIINFNGEVLIDSSVYVNNNAIINFSSASITQELVLNNGIINFNDKSFLNDVQVNNGRINFKDSIMRNFDVLGGAVNFTSNISTALNLNVENGAVLSLSNGDAEGKLEVENDFYLAGVLNVDIDFAGGFSDWIEVGGNFQVEHSTLSVTTLAEGTAATLVIVAYKNLIGDILDFYFFDDKYSLVNFDNKILLAT
ncbi:MAG: hypothetical protein LBC07_07025, partial [Elusimicrobiota bacterium]|nr:hypothetical protein [Elusimicrobiota bacterium]